MTTDTDLLALCAELRALVKKMTREQWVVMESHHPGHGTTLQISDSADHTNENAIVHWMGFDYGDKPWAKKIANAKGIASLHNAADTLLSATEASVRMRELLQKIMYVLPPLETKQLREDIEKELAK